jgi:tetratricopeptide (TPR) repeat protein
MEATYQIPWQAEHRLTGEDRAYFDPPLNEGRGAYLKAAQEHGGDILSSEGRARFLLSTELQAQDLVADHEVTRARAAMAHLTPAETQGAVQLADIETGARAQLEDWEGVLALTQSYPGGGPAQALAHARLGHIETAKAMVAATPLDCDTCVVVRGEVAAAAHDWPAADRWFDLVVRRTPHSPMNVLAWGQVLASEGDFDGAIAKLRIAHARGPDFADPLEIWGEALMAKRDYAGAISKFAEADKHAPRWGRNHLYWGEALMLSSRYAEARQQYEAAIGMDLSKPDRAALDVLLARTAKGPLHG